MLEGPRRQTLLLEGADEEEEAPSRRPGGARAARRPPCGSVAAIAAGCSVALVCLAVFAAEFRAVARDGRRAPIGASAAPAAGEALRRLEKCSKGPGPYAACNRTRTQITASTKSTVVVVRVGQPRQDFWFATDKKGSPRQQLAQSRGAYQLANCPTVRRIVIAWWHPAPPPVPFGVYRGKLGEALIHVADHRTVGLGERVVASRLETGNSALDAENVVLFDDDTSLSCSSLAALAAASHRWPDKIAAPYMFCRRITTDTSGHMVYDNPGYPKKPWRNVAITPAILMKTALLRKAEKVMPRTQVDWSSQHLQGEDVMLSWAVAKVSGDGRTAVCVDNVPVRVLAGASAGGLSWSIRTKFPKQENWKLYLQFRSNVSDQVARAIPLSKGHCAPLPAVMARREPQKGGWGVLVQSQGDAADRAC